MLLQLMTTPGAATWLQPTPSGLQHVTTTTEAPARRPRD